MGDTITVTKSELEKTMLEAQGDVMKANEKLEAAIEKMQGEIDNAKHSSVESRNELEKLTTKADQQTKRAIESEQRLTEIEQRGNDGSEAADESIGAQFTKSADYAAMVERQNGSARMEVKTAIINTFPASSVQPLVQGDRLSGIHTVPNRRLTIKDILPVGTTQSNLVEFTRENALKSLKLAA